MKSIILAAGEGSRLKPYTDAIPKCLIPIAGKSILDWQIIILQKCGVNNIIVVKGYKGEKIQRADLRYFINKDWSTTNMVKTLFCAEKELEGEVIITYGDIIYEESVLRKLIAAKYDISVVVDLGWIEYWKQRSTNPLKDAESLLFDQDGIISSIGQKISEISEPNGQYIGMIKFSSKGSRIIKQVYNEMLSESNKKCKILDTNRSLNKIFMTDFLQQIINLGFKVHVVPINRKWMEIDTPRDYEIAKRSIKTNQNDLIILR